MKNAINWLKPKKVLGRKKKELIQDPRD